MKRLLGTVTLSLAIALAGCATEPQMSPQAAQLVEWRDSARQKALDGSMKWTDYYIQYHDRLGSIPSSPHKSIEMMMVAELIPSARRYESGELTKDQFYDIRRIVGTKYQAKHDQIEMQDQREQAEATGAALQGIGKALTPKPTVNCTTTSFPGSYSSTTNCR